MMCNPPTPSAGACSTDADRDGSDESAHLPEWVVHLIALFIHCMLRRMLAARLRHASLPTWWHDRPDLPLASAQSEAASVRGHFGNSIRWMCIRRGIGPGHPDWPELSRAIVAFGGSLKGFRAGARATGLQWWENPGVIPGLVADTPATPAATALASMLSRQAAAAAPSPAPKTIVRSEAEPAPPPVFRRQVFARTTTGPPTGPPAVRAHQFSYA